MENLIYKKASSYEAAPEKTEKAFDFAKGYMTFLDNAKTEREAVDAAIALASAKGYKEYKIGDLGFVRLNSLKYESLPDKYRSCYTAPEVEDAFAPLNDTIDILFDSFSCTLDIF